MIDNRTWRVRIHIDTNKNMVIICIRRQVIKIDKLHLLTEKELIEKLCFSRSMIYRLRKKGMPYKKISRTIRYDEQEVRDWIDKQPKD